MVKSAVVAVITAGSLLLGACPEGRKVIECSGSAECDSVHACIASSCLQRCTTATDCTGTQVCQTAMTAENTSDMVCQPGPIASGATPCVPDNAPWSGTAPGIAAVFVDQAACTCDVRSTSADGSAAVTLDLNGPTLTSSIDVFSVSSAEPAGITFMDMNGWWRVEGLSLDTPTTLVLMGSRQVSMSFTATTTGVSGAAMSCQ